LIMGRCVNAVWLFKTELTISSFNELIRCKTRRRNTVQNSPWRRCLSE
jgi:hypothetical protein